MQAIIPREKLCKTVHCEVSLRFTLAAVYTSCSLSTYSSFISNIDEENVNLNRRDFIIVDVKLYVAWFFKHVRLDELVDVDIEDDQNSYENKRNYCAVSLKYWKVWVLA
jgi:hypothetical protein